MTRGSSRMDSVENLVHTGMMGLRIYLSDGKWQQRPALANQTPWIYADINFHDEVAEAAEVRLGLVRRVGRNQQPIAGLYFESLCTDHRLAAVFAGNNAILILKILAIGNFPTDNHFAGSPGENVEIVSAGVFLGIVEDTVDFGQAENRLIAKHAIEHEHTEIAGLHVHRAAAKRL